MGIPGFYRNYLVQQVPQALLNRLPRNVSSLAFDLNGVFHEARNQLFSSKDPRIKAALALTSPEQLKLEMFNLIGTIILNAVEAVNPRDCLILAVDGVAPGGKMQQQKGRRERAARERDPESVFDGNAITPGTDFMRDLDAYLLRFIESQRSSLPPKVIYSSQGVPGEGEHKIMDFYRDGTITNGSSGGVHVIRGLDADLIMLALIAPVDHIYLARESESDVVDIDQFKQYLQDRTKRATAVDDFVVMMFLLGNDFLPKSPSLEEMTETIQFLIETYTTGNYTLTTVDENDQPQIVWEGMIAFIQAISVQENRFLTQAATRPTKFPSRFLEMALIGGKFYPETFRAAWYTNALGPKGSPEFTAILSSIIDRYDPTEDDLLVNPVGSVTNVEFSRVDPDQIAAMCRAYVRTLAWIYLYYKRGTSAINQDWLYPYYHTPLLVDLATEIQNVTHDYPVRGYAAHSQMINFTALHQLIAVLPLKSKDLLPVELQPLFDNNSPIRDLFPTEFLIELDGKHAEHQGVPIVPLVNRQRIVDAVRMIYIGPTRAQLWLPAQNEEFLAGAKDSKLYARQAALRQQNALQTRDSNRGDRRSFESNRGSERGLRGSFESNRGSERGPRRSFESNRGSERGSRGSFDPNRGPRRSPPAGSVPRTNPAYSPQRGAPLITRGGTLITRLPSQPLEASSSFRGSRGGPSLTPMGTTLPPGVSVGRGGRGGPSLTPLGTTLPPGVSVGRGGRGGPSLTPLGTTFPPGVTVGRGGRGGPSLTPLGTTLPSGVTVGRDVSTVPYPSKSPRPNKSPRPGTEWQETALI